MIKQTTRRSFSVDEPKTFEKQPATGMWRVRWWKRWCTVLVGRDHRRDRRQVSDCRRRDWGWARRFGGCWSNDGGLRQGRDPLCVIGGVVEGEEGVTREKSVASSRRKFFQITTAAFDPSWDTAARTNKG
jgi:hypothetical protein